MNAVWCKRIVPGISATILALSTGMIFAASNDKDDNRTFHARLTGYQEVPAVSTTARGEFKAKIDPVTGVVDYELTYDGLQGKVTQSHIHIGQRHTTGGITIWLCQTTGTPAPAAVAGVTPFCKEPGGTVTGSFSSANVIGPAAQLVTTGQLDEVLEAMRAGAAYVNVHSSSNAATGSPGVPSGEIRGQLRRRP